MEWISINKLRKRRCIRLFYGNMKKLLFILFLFISNILFAQTNIDLYLKDFNLVESLKNIQNLQQFMGLLMEELQCLILKHFLLHQANYKKEL